MKFYVYEHVRPDTGQIFYVGKGFGKRAWFLKERNRHHMHIIGKLARIGMVVEVRLIATGLKEQEAFELEIKRIAELRRNKISLVNLTDGGEGISGLKFSEKSKLMMSNAHKGKTLSAEHRAKISEKSKLYRHSNESKQKISESNKRRKLSEETKAKIGAKHRGRKRKPFTKETIARMSAAQKGRIISTEARNKLSAAMKGKKRGPRLAEWKENISNGLKRRWKERKDKQTQKVAA